MLALLSSCAGWQRPNTVETIFFAVSEAIAATDSAQSFDFPNHPALYEQNPLLGRHPSQRTFVVAGLAALTLNAAVWYALPPHWRLLPPVAVTAIDGPIVLENFALGLRPRLPK